MDEQVTRVIAEYEERSRRESPIVAAFSTPEYLRERDAYLLDIGRDSATFLNILIKASRPRCIVEVGTSYGYSTLWLAEAARATGGRVITFEASASKLQHAREKVEEAGLGAYVEFRPGDALIGIPLIEEPIDFALIDLWKELYVPALDALYPKLAAAAIITADNICLPQIHAPAMQAYVAHVRSLPGIQSVTVPVGSGIELSRFTRD